MLARTCYASQPRTQAQRLTLCWWTRVVESSAPERAAFEASRKVAAPHGLEVCDPYSEKVFVDYAEEVIDLWNEEAIGPYSEEVIDSCNEEAIGSCSEAIGLCSEEVIGPCNLYSDQTFLSAGVRRHFPGATVISCAPYFAGNAYYKAIVNAPCGACESHHHTYEATGAADYWAESTYWKLAVASGW
jgi:hypothetical protein